MRLMRVGGKRIKPDKQGNNIDYFSTFIYITTGKRIKPDKQGNNSDKLNRNRLLFCGKRIKPDKQGNNEKLQYEEEKNVS